MADPTASIWEVTRLILDDPEASPQEIAEAHGFTMVEIAETLPILLENTRADFTQTSAAAAGGAHDRPPEPQPGESAEDFAGRCLTELRESAHLDLVSYDSLGQQAGDWFDPGFDDLLGGPPYGVPGTVPPSTNGFGIPASAAEVSSQFGAGGQPATNTGPPDPTTQTGPDPVPDLDLTTDDPFGPDEQQVDDDDRDRDDRDSDTGPSTDGPDEVFDLT